MKIKVSPPKNISQPEHLFDALDYDAYSPDLLPSPGYTLVTRIGQCFSCTGIIRRTMYTNTYVFLRSLFVALSSIIRRGVSVISNEDNNISIIHTPWSAGYYHWITESIPRALYCLEQDKNCKFMLPSHDRYSSYLESLSLIGINNVDYFPSGKNILLKKALITTIPKQFGITDPVYLERIRDIYTKAVRQKDDLFNLPKRRVYVTRKQARGRKIINEDDLITLLEKYGFETIAFEDFSFVEQVRLMSNTEVLISIHGAALTNMIFMPSNGIVFEFIPKKRFLLDFNIVRCSFKHDPCYVRLASALGHSYFTQICKPINLIDRTTHMADMIVDIELLKINLDSIYKKNAVKEPIQDLGN